MSTPGVGFSESARAGTQADIFTPGVQMLPVTYTVKTALQDPPVPFLEQISKFDLSLPHGFESNRISNIVQYDGAPTYLMARFFTPEYEILDVTDPSAPISFGYKDLTANDVTLRSLTMDSGYLYLWGPKISDATKGRLLIVDLTDPNNILSTTDFTASLAIYGIVVSGNYLYTSVGTKLLILDVTDKSAPTQAAAFEVDAVNNTLQVQKPTGNYCYALTRDEARLYVIDVTAPGSPSISGSVLVGGGVGAVNAYNPMLFVSTGLIYVLGIDLPSGELRLFSVNATTPGTPTSSATSLATLSTPNVQPTQMSFDATAGVLAIASEAPGGTPPLLFFIRTSDYVQFKTKWAFPADGGAATGVQFFSYTGTFLNTRSTSLFLYNFKLGPLGADIDGNAYRVLPTGTGSWAGHDKELAEFGLSEADVWGFTIPTGPDSVFQTDDQTSFVFDNGSNDWIADSSGTIHNGLNFIELLTFLAAPDTTYTGKFVLFFLAQVSSGDSFKLNLLGPSLPGNPDFLNAGAVVEIVGGSLATPKVLITGFGDFDSTFTGGDLPAVMVIEFSVKTRADQVGNQNISLRANVVANKTSILAGSSLTVQRVTT